mgnify:CR=1 FL=1
MVDASATPMQASVRYTAIGSFMPDSISSVASTRSFSRTPEVFSNENTAAASVDPTMAPISNAMAQGKSSSQCAAMPVTTAHTSTPTVASHSDPMTTEKIRTDSGVIGNMMNSAEAIALPV